ncbi:MAG: helix-turn-helix domain-containing protein [Bacteroidota bacterium]|nr:helix-turn-helix domain-containing protein [Bacteroidota bacterium]
MELKDFLREYLKRKKLSVRKFAEMLMVSKYRMEKWEKGIHPTYEDSVKIKRYFGVKDLQNFSEEFLKTFEPKVVEVESDEVLKLKDMLIDEKNKRIQNLEETISLLREVQEDILSKKRVSKRVSNSKIY